MPITLDSLRCFCAVVDTGSFREAGEKLNRSQPAISQQIKSLERSIGKPLLDRKAGAATPVGNLLYARAQRLLLDAEAMAREVDDLDAINGQEIHIGASDTTALYVLPPVVRAFSADAPETRIIMQTRSSDQIAEKVLAGDLDLGVVTLPVSHAELDALPLLEADLVYVTARDSSHAKRPSTLAKLSDTPLVLLDRQTRTGRLLHAHFDETGFRPQILLDSGSFEVIKRYVAEGLGASFVPDYVVAKGDAELVKHRMRGLPQVGIGVITRRGAYQSRATRNFLTTLQAHAKKTHVW